MQDITHLPMGLMWQMPIPVACSLAVAARGLAVSCGQCPLDTKGEVLHPGDAGSQAGLVAGMVQGVLSHLPGHYPVILVVYHDAANESEVLSPLRGVFPDAVLLPVRLPHFYYPGMRIEVDVYALGAPPVTRQAHGLSRIFGGPVELVALCAGDMAEVGGLLAGLDPAKLLSAQWFSADPAPHDWHPDPAARVILPKDAGVSAVLTLAPDPVQVSQTPGGAIKRTSGCFVWMSAQGQGSDLAAAAHQAMDALALDRQQNLTILKATTHYVGGSGPEDLHGNLAVRHARFPTPGPASTGVPVAGLAGGSLAIDMLGIVG